MRVNEYPRDRPRTVGDAIRSRGRSARLFIPEVSKPPNLAKRGGCWFVRDALKVHLGVENDFRPARKAHPALLVEDLTALKTLIESAGYTVKTDEPL